MTLLKECENIVHYGFAQKVAKPAKQASSRKPVALAPGTYDITSLEPAIAGESPAIGIRLFGKESRIQWPVLHKQADWQGRLSLVECAH